MIPWAFCEDLSTDDGKLEDQEAHHLIHVLRLVPGSPLTVFDGLGTEATAVVSATSRRDISFRITSRHVHPRPLRQSLTVAASPAKADRLRWMVEKLTEIGVDRLILLHTERTVVTPGDARQEKLRASVVAACKQCRRPYLMEIHSLQPLSSVLQDFQKSLDSAQLFIAHPGEAPVPSQPHGSFRHGDISVLIGPEGGFTDEEVAAAISAGAVPVSWPGTILRIETAAIVFGALLMSRCYSSGS